MNFSSNDIERGLLGLGNGLHQLSYEVDGRKVHFNLRLEKGSETLVILFHGAVDLEKRTPPVFVVHPKELRGIVSMMSIADPLIDPSIGCRTTWYAGSSTFNTQKVLKQFISTVVRAFEIKKTIYYGSSSGGFAALYFSYYHPESMVICSNPQVRITSYHPAAVSAYMAKCWPALQVRSELESVTSANLLQLYSNGFENTIIYIQSVGDFIHCDRFMMPFISAVKKSKLSNKLILNTDYFGRLGHAASPSTDSLWLEAAVAAEKGGVQELLSAKHYLLSKRVPEILVGKKGEAEKKPLFAKSDMEIAERIRLHRAYQG